MAVRKTVASKQGTAESKEAPVDLQPIPVSKSTLNAIARAAITDPKAQRPSLEHVRVRHSGKALRMEATNGRSLLRVDVGEFKQKKKETAQDTYMVHGSAIVSAAKVIKASDTADVVNTLDAGVMIGHYNAAKAKDLKFPEFDLILPKESTADESRAEIHFDPRLLAAALINIADAIGYDSKKQYSTPRVTLSFSLAPEVEPEPTEVLGASNSSEIKLNHKNKIDATKGVKLTATGKNGVSAVSFVMPLRP